MSHITIVDLNRGNELSSTEMRPIAGGSSVLRSMGMSCADAKMLSDANHAFGDIMTGLGDSGAAAWYYGLADGQVQGAC